jgi:hypothetical protein
MLNRVKFILAAVAMGLLAGPVMAHDVELSQTFNDMNPITVNHMDQDPWKGYVDVTVTNNSAQDWGDFHFQIFQIPNEADVSNVHIIETTSPPEDDTTPDCSQSGFTYVIDNAAVGATLDYYFYDDPVAVGEQASFKFYTDNTTDNVNFGVAMWPSPVPEPMTLSLLAVGAAALRCRRKRK